MAQVLFGPSFRRRGWPAPALVLVLALAGFPSLPAQAAAPAVALPDTGLFAPVAAELRAHLARLAELPPRAAGPEAVGLLLDTGAPEQAARRAAALPSDDAETRVARARAALAVQDFATASP